MEEGLAGGAGAAAAHAHRPPAPGLDVGIPLSVLFTGYFNGFGVEVKSEGEMSLLYRMGCFGKGSASRSKPQVLRDNGAHQIMRRRQFQKRVFWAKKFKGTSRSSERESALREEIAVLMTQIKETPNVQSNKDVIDLVSSDEENQNGTDEDTERAERNDASLSGNIDGARLVIVVPNSDSENENYFENFKPKCCLNKIKLDETLILTLQEAYFLAYALGCLQILDYDKNTLTLEQSWKLFIDTDKFFETKYIVYHYFRSKGYVVKSGIKFGGDYLLYRDGPGQSHADYIVVIKYPQIQADWLQILGHIRMAGTTSKEILMAEVKPAVEEFVQDYSSPKNLCNYTVQETILHRKIPSDKDDDYEA